MKLLLVQFSVRIVYSILMAYTFHTSYASVTCNSDLTSFKIILSCIDQNSPRILQANALKREAEALPKKARQWRNPDLSFNAFLAEPSNPDGTQIQGSVLFPLDLANVRSSRGEKVELEQKEISISASIERQDVLVSNYLALHRIRQLSSQITILEETNSSLEKLISTFQRRPSLSPDLEASRELLKLALQEHRNKIELYVQERRRLIHDIEIEIDSVWTPRIGNLPSSPKHWPKLTSPLSVQNSLVTERLKVTLEKEIAGINVARAERHPVPSVGPFVGWSKVPTQSGIQAGVTLQIPLPIIENFAGTIDLAQRGRDRAKITSEVGLRKERGELNHNREIYENSVSALNRMESLKTSRDRVKRLEQLFRQGSIPGLALVDMLRQDLALRQSHDEIEVNAIQAWCHIQAIQNRVEDCFL